MSYHNQQKLTAASVTIPQHSLEYILCISPLRKHPAYSREKTHRNKAPVRHLQGRGSGAWYHTLAVSHLFVSYQDAVRVLVLTRDFIVRDEVGQLLDKVHHLLMPGDVGHSEVAGWAFAAVCHTLRRNVQTITASFTLHKVRAVQPHQLQQALKIVSFVPPLHCVLQKGKKCGDSIRNLSQWHITKPVYSGFLSSKTQVSLFPGKQL